MQKIPPLQFPAGLDELLDQPGQQPPLNVGNDEFESNGALDKFSESDSKAQSFLPEYKDGGKQRIPLSTRKLKMRKKGKMTSAKIPLLTGCDNGASDLSPSVIVVEDKASNDAQVCTCHFC